MSFWNCNEVSEDPLFYDVIKRLALRARYFVGNSVVNYITAGKTLNNLDLNKFHSCARTATKRELCFVFLNEMCACVLKWSSSKHGNQSLNKVSCCIYLSIYLIIQYDTIFTVDTFGTSRHLTTQITTSYTVPTGF